MTKLIVTGDATAYWNKTTTLESLNTTGSTTLPHGAVLYVPLSHNNEDERTTLEAWKLVTAFQNAQNALKSSSDPIFAKSPGKLPATLEASLNGNVSFFEGVTVYIPYRPSTDVVTLDIASLSSALATVYGSKATTSHKSPGTSTASNTGGSAGQTSRASQSSTSSYVTATGSTRTGTDNSINTTSSASNVGAGSGTGAISSQGTHPPGSQDDEVNIGAIAGGTVGGFLIGMLLCGLVSLLWRRRRPKQTTSRSSQHRKLISEDAAESKEMQLFDKPTTVTGWQKHLPQDNDDGTIANAFQTIFDQVQIHVEGSYNARSSKISSEAITAIERVAPAGLAKRLTEAPNGHPLLEAVLIRWILHRISLRSDAGDSFFPFAYTKVPELNRWHMECDEQGNGSATESKRGFPQAFSQWRVLTAFLHPDPRTEQEFKKALEIKIDRGVENFTKAFLPWDKQGGSVKNRKDSLRRILQLANDAGLLLFAQNSTFMFDWSGKDGSVTVSPALVKRLDEFSKLLSPAPVLISPRRINV